MTTTTIGVFKADGYFYAQIEAVASEHKRHPDFRALFAEKTATDLGKKLRFFKHSVAFTKIVFEKEPFLFVLAQNTKVLQAQPLNLTDMVALTKGFSGKKFKVLEVS